jgi:aspartate/tyrosine/aromatic aminotransferase
MDREKIWKRIDEVEAEIEKLETERNYAFIVGSNEYNELTEKIRFRQGYAFALKELLREDREGLL